MTNPYSSGCDEALLDRYLEGDLGADEEAMVKNHLDGCRQCRRRVAGMEAVSRQFRDRVQQAADAVDFMAFEKQVLNKALRQRHPGGGFFAFIASLRYPIAAAVAVGVLLFFGYSRYMVKPGPVPSAIINSFTGPVSSVMIFETPETRQTILWYKEETDTESEQNAI